MENTINIVKSRLEILTLEIIVMEQYIERCIDPYKKQCLKDSLLDKKGLEKDLIIIKKELKKHIN